MKNSLVKIAVALIPAIFSSCSGKQDSLKFIFLSDIHVESDFMERGKPCYTQWEPGNHAAVERTFKFINEDPFCKDAEFILMGGDQINTGYSRKQNDLDAEMVNFRRLLGSLDIYRQSLGTDLSKFKFEAPTEYLCKENLAAGQKPLRFRSPELNSKVIPIQGNHDTGVPEFYRNCAFQCKGTRFICFFASYRALPAPKGSYRSTGAIEDETFNFVKGQIEKAAADKSIKHIVLVCHWGISNDIEKFSWPIVDACPANGMNDNRAKLLALCEKYGCSLYINGHEHSKQTQVGMFGGTPDVNCGAFVEGSWYVVEIKGDEALFHQYTIADAEAALPEKVQTITVPLGKSGDRSVSNGAKRVVVRMQEADYASLAAAADEFIKANIQFAMERLPREDDTPEMKELLQIMLWKNNELTDKVELPESIEIVDLKPGEEGALLKRIADEGWTVKVPAAWKKIIAEENRTFSYKNYYVSADGDDSADGLTPKTAWKSLDKVNSSEFGYGDSILFRAGDIFRGHLEPLSGRPGGEITYSSYGKGAKPVIEPSFDASHISDWVKVGDNLWKCVKVSNNELANVIFNHGDKGCAWKEDRLELLAGQDLHFAWVKDENAVYMVSGVNPASRFSSIEIAEKQHIIMEAECHDVRYDGLWLRYGGAHGIGGDCVKRITIKNCDICWIGGSTLYFDNGGRSVRYGNGIEFWSAAEDILVEGCRIWECWDAGITNQSNENGKVQKNITYRANTIWNCEYSYEYWQQGDGAKTINILFENNICRDAGKGWGHTRRWNPNAAHLMFYDTTAETSGFVIRGNVFENTENCGIRLFNAWYKSIRMEGNKWIINSNLLCRYHGRPTSDLIFKYPDHLDAAHSDDEAEIQGQTIEEPMVFGAGEKELERFKARFGF